jgi:hypothetical protein
MNQNCKTYIAGVFALFALSVSAFAGTYATITLDNTYTDWDGIATATTDATGDGDPVDFTEVYVANDDDYLYIRFTLDTATALNGTGSQIFIGIDNDNNTATGYDVYSLGIIGTEVAWQNDYPFAQDTGTFNSGTITDGAALVAGYNSVVSGQEIGISRSATFTDGGESIFPNDTISIIIYSNGTTADDVIGTVSYTFAVPEPSSAALLMSIVCLVSVATMRRKN